MEAVIAKYAVPKFLIATAVSNPAAGTTMSIRD